jgi:hypothetical protein
MAQISRGIPSLGQQIEADEAFHISFALWQDRTSSAAEDQAVVMWDSHMTTN